MSKPSFGFLASLVVVLLVGCSKGGPPFGTVTGRITLEDEPVERAFVEFHGDGSVCYAVAPTDEDGKYEMKFEKDREGIPVATYQVQISTQDWLKQEDGSNKVLKERIPKHYVGIDSILTFAVESGENSANFELSKKKPKD